MLTDMNKIMKTLRLGPDARSSRGTLARGTNVYGPSGGASAITPSLQKLALRKIRERQLGK